MMKTINIALTSDHAGFDKKGILLNYLKNKGINCTDLGPYSVESTDYPDWAHLIASKVEAGEYDLGITLCGSGNGINIAANKYQGIRSALCWTPEIAVLAKQHNNANIIALPARFINNKEMKEIVEAFLNAEFEGGRHKRRVDKIPLK